jgi:hypothetical protein
MLRAEPEQAVRTKRTTLAGKKTRAILTILTILTMPADAGAKTR